MYLEIALIMRVSFIFLIGLSLKLYSQSPVIKNTELFDLLFQKQTATLATEISNNYQFFDPFDKRFTNYSQFLVKNGNGLFCLIQATGRVYKLNKINKDSISVNRIDSTHFYGYNNSAIIFSNNDTIFSFGGNGFWNYNGQLRYFDQKQHEWNIIEIENEIPGSQTLFYVDQKKDILYYISNNYRKPSTGKLITGNEVISLDLKTKQIRILGNLNPKISELFVNMNSLNSCTITEIKSLNAVLFCFDVNNKYLINFEENTIKKLISNKISDLYFGNSNTIRPRTIFEEKGILYYTMSNDSTLHVLQEKIDLNNFEAYSEPLYTSSKISISSLKNLLLIVLLFIMLISGIFYFIYINKFKLEKQQVETKSHVFSPLEIELIKSILDKSTKGEKNGCSAEHINGILGLKKKTIEIQKKTRTETISRINQKYKNQFETSEDLIIRHRTEEDRRFYRYLVKEESANNLLSSL